MTCRYWPSWASMGRQGQASVEDLQPAAKWVGLPGEESYPLTNVVRATSLRALCDRVSIDQPVHGLLTVSSS